MPPRLEFRVFGDDLAPEREILHRSAAEAEEEEFRTDIYFVVPGRIDASLKVRGADLDLKVLRQRRDRLELWEPAAAAEFPVAPETLEAELLGPAGVRLDLPDAPVGRDLLLALGRAAPETRLVRIEKHRRRCSLDGVAAEFTRLLVADPSVGRRPLESLAIEDTDGDRAIRAVATLKLSKRRNTSYQRFLVETLFAAKDPGNAPA